MIDGLVSQLGDTVVKLWQRDDGGTGKYPPPTLHVSRFSEDSPGFKRKAARLHVLLWE